MPKFFFHVLNDVGHTADCEGMDLPDVQAVDAQARRAIGAIAADELAEGKNDITLTVMVDDSAGMRIRNLKAVLHLVASAGPIAN